MRWSNAMSFRFPMKVDRCRAYRVENSLFSDNWSCRLYNLPHKREKFNANQFSVQDDLVLRNYWVSGLFLMIRFGSECRSHLGVYAAMHFASGVFAWVFLRVRRKNRTYRARGPKIWQENGKLNNPGFRFWFPILESQSRY